MTIFVDADSCPAAARAILQRRAAKENIPLVFAANRPIPFDAPFIKYAERGLFVMALCPAAENAADDLIVERVRMFDIVCTRDVPLAARSIEKGARALDDRGRIFSQENIRYHLSVRNAVLAIVEESAEVLRAAHYGEKEKRAFAAGLDKLITEALKKDSQLVKALD